MSAIKILKDNSNGKENTFIGILHEENKIDIPSFLTLFDAILEIVNNNLSNREVDRVIVKIHSFILNSIVNHLDKNDLFKISNYNTSISRNILERLNVIVESYFNGKKVQEEIFSDKLRSIKK
ncbi:MAG: hypothetical protein H6625_00610 [Bdellovibrionaceae bacterium]|nr:hypothetical protein [Pseudobdellovibrionaceae bacterium]